MVHLLSFHFSLFSAVRPFGRGVLSAAAGPRVFGGGDELAWIIDKFDDPFGDLFYRERFDQVIIRADVARFDDLMHFGIAGQHDDGDERVHARLTTADLFDEIKTVHLRHAPVTEDEIDLIAIQHLKCGFAIIRAVGFPKAKILEDIRYELLHETVIIHDHNTEIS